MVASMVSTRIEGPVLVRTRQGFSVWVDASDIVVGRTLINDGQFEPGIAKFIGGFLSPGDVAVDIGANVGYYAGVMAEAVGENGQIVALEPAPVTFSLLEKTISTNGWVQVTPVQAAAGTGAGSLDLRLDPLNWGNHSFVGNATAESVSVRVDRLAELLPATRSGPVKLVKIDVQGWEGHVLSGADDVLDERPIVVLEFHPEMLQRSDTNPEVLLASLFDRSKGVYLLDGESGLTRSMSSPSDVLAACREARWAQVDIVADLPGSL